MEWEELNKQESEECFNNIDFENFSYHDVDNKYKKLYLELSDKFDDVLEEIEDIKKSNPKNNKRLYYIDCLFGLALFRTMNKFGLTYHDANNNDIWRFISIKVIPDIVYERWGDNANRYYGASNRIWLKSIWWYVYISLQFKNGKPDYDFTKQMLLEFDTDYILNIVDRSGHDGFRLKLSRLLIRKLYENKAMYPINRFHRKIMILNTARLRVFDPEMYEGGIEGYIDDLFNYFLNGEIGE